MNCTQGKQSLCLAAAWVGTLDSEKLDYQRIQYYLKARCPSLVTWKSEESVKLGELRPTIAVPGSDLYLIGGLRMEIVDHIVMIIQVIWWSWNNFGHQKYLGTFSICIQSNEWKFFLLLLNRHWLNAKINFHLYLPLILWVTMIETRHSVCLFWLETWNKKLFEKLEKYLIKNFFMLQN